MNSNLLFITVSFQSIFFLIGLFILGGLLGVLVNKFYLSRKEYKSEKTAKKIIEDALADVKRMKKEAVLDAREEAHKVKVESDRKINEKYVELQKQEDQLERSKKQFEDQKKDVDKKEQSLKDQEEHLKTKQEQLDKYISETEKKKNEIISKLEQVSQMSKDEAKKEIITNLVDDAKAEAAKTVKEIVDEAKDEADKNAKEILSVAIQRYAADHTADITVTSINLPNDEMKGRIIGREGRNIRALEKATGVDLIVDDTPEAVVLSSFDPVRREIARRSLEKLIEDGRIHPTRIEEVVEKVRKEVDQVVKEAGEDALIQTGVHNLDRTLVKTLGQLKFRTSYGQNVLKHTIEVANLAGLLANELGVNAHVAKRGALLHDIGKAIDHDTEGTHVSIGVKLARKHGEKESVIHCIEAHHGDVEFESIEAIIVQVADAISSARPGARRENLDAYIKRLESLEKIASEFEGVDTAYAIQAGREVRVIVKPEKIDDKNAVYLAKEIAKKIEDEVDYPGRVKVNVVRESRSVAYAD